MHITKKQILILLLVLISGFGAGVVFLKQIDLTVAKASDFGLEVNSKQSLYKSSNRLKIGTALSSKQLEYKNYKSILNQDFNLIVAENEMKWNQVETAKGVYNFSNIDKIIDYAVKNGHVVHGHTLVWYSNIPDWVNTYLESLPIDQRPTALDDILKNYITTVVSKYKDKIVSWDVVNEVIADEPQWAIEPKSGYRDGSVFQKYLPDRDDNGVPDYIELAFKYAHEADPNSKLYYNDYNIEYLNTTKINDLKQEKLDLVNKKSQAAFNMVQALIKNKVPINGVGIQAHITSKSVLDNQFEDQNSIRNYPVYKTMKAYQDLGMELRISEMDVRVSAESPAKPSDGDLSKQASTYSNYLLSCKLIDSCTSFTVWQFSDNFVWYGKNFPGKKEDYHPNLFDRNYQPKPAYFALLKTLNEN
jgi:endo-1,4-beta-xylanase